MNLKPQNDRPAIVDNLKTTPFTRGGLFDIIPLKIKRGGFKVARKIKQIEGQLCLDMCLNSGNYVVQANNLIAGKQSLSINSAKILRSAIMQIQKDDTELKPYVITTRELADLLHITTDNIYRVIDNVSDELITSYAEARAEYGERKKFKKISWVSFCEYDSEIGFAIKLNQDMKPYLLNLKERYTQYTLDNILSMKSVYGIRIFELLQEKIISRVLPKQGTDIILSVQYIRECCDCEDKYERFSQFKTRVLDRAVEEIERVTMYTLSYSYIKKGRMIESIVFHINMKYH